MCVKWKRRMLRRHCWRRRGDECDDTGCSGFAKNRDLSGYGIEHVDEDFLELPFLLFAFEYMRRSNCTQVDEDYSACVVRLCV